MEVKNALQTRTFYLTLVVTGSIFYFYGNQFTVDLSRPRLFTKTFFSRSSNFSIDAKTNLNSNTNTSKNVIDSMEYKNVVDSLKDNNLTSKSLPVILQPIGGIGNQLFQYATAYVLAKRRNSDLYICTNETKLGVPHAKENRTFEPFKSNERSFSLDIFNVPIDNLLIIPPGQKECNYTDVPPGNLSKDTFYFNESHFLNNTIPKDKVVQIDLYSYFVSEIFFEDYKDELKKQLHLEIDPIPEQLKSIIDDINQSESVSVHVRKRDFLLNPRDNRSIPISYYVRATKLLSETLVKNNITTGIDNVKFFVFSDDIEKVKREFRELFKSENYSMTFVSNRNFSRIVDFFLMSHCKHNINGNSTFAWWAAYLNHHKQRLVVAPLPKFDRKWLINLTGNNTQSQKYIMEHKINYGEWTYPKDWITINPFEPEE